MRRGKQTAVDNNQIGSIIGQHASFSGELKFEGAVRIDGNFDGDIHASNGGTLIVSEVAHITGEVDVPNLVLHGTISGNVRASESLKISETGKLKGDVEYKVISLSEGALINGRCSRIDDKQTATFTSGKDIAIAGTEKIGQAA
ncbi:MAG: polymer-forming cytoskeletal protein [Mariprofundaceae bacterium]|nr:polymer-forming cytoskeletal protein [Mariprofundaceae bacterium]